jgi:hypothetical protein
MNTQLAHMFLDECFKAFAFLVEDYGFTPPVLNMNPSISFSTVTFVGTNLALECIFDERENWVEFKVAQVIDGVVAQSYAIDKKGQRVRESLFSLLQRRGARNFGLQEKDLSSVSTLEMFKAKLAAYAELLLKYGQDILSDSASVFSNPLDQTQSS